MSQKPERPNLVQSTLSLVCKYFEKHKFHYNSLRSEQVGNKLIGLSSQKKVFIFRSVNFVTAAAFFSEEGLLN